MNLILKCNENELNYVTGGLFDTIIVNNNYDEDPRRYRNKNTREATNLEVTLFGALFTAVGLIMCVSGFCKGDKEGWTKKF